MPPCTAGVAAPDGAAASSSDDESSSEEIGTVKAFENNGTTKTEGDDTPFLDFRNATEWISFMFGCIFLITIGPPVGLVVFAAMIWEALDRGFDGGFVGSGKELTGFIFAKFVPWLRNSTHQFNSRFVKRPEDAYMMNCIVGFGVVVPILFFGCAWYVQNFGMSYTLAFFYHLFRIGPFFMNFAYVYTLCHKEGHSHAGLYSKGYNDSIVLRNVFNWWIGMFYGVLPATFAYGHSLNHHRYNNGPLDIVTTADKPRDNFANWVAYIPRFWLYAANISTIDQFAREKNYKVCLKAIYGTVYFFLWFALCAVLVNPTFAVCFVAFPWAEANLLLACINWSWHGFVDPTDPSNEYVNSLTILDGAVNVLNEDYHVVHHAVPGAHWTDHVQLCEKVWDKYIDNRATCFRGTHAFEVFGMSVARDYDALASKFVDLKGERDGCPMTHAEKVVLMKKRLRGCWWGPRFEEQEELLKKRE